MHPSPCKHNRSLRIGLAVALLAWLLSALGCNSHSSPAAFYGATDTLFQSTAKERAAALEALQSMKQGPFKSAFARLPAYAFTRYVRTDQFAPGGQRTAFEERVARFHPDAGTLQHTLLRRDSAGSFEFDTFDRFAPTGTPDTVPTRLPRHLLPEDPPYLAPRTRERYRYRLFSDTLASGTAVQAVEVHVRPIEGSDAPSIRHARLYIEPESRNLVGIYFVRSDQAALFREDSRFFASLRPAPDSGWVPHVTRFRARVAVPLRTPQEFRTVSAYYDYAPADTSSRPSS